MSLSLLNTFLRRYFAHQGLNDGRFHTVLLSVRGVVASLIVDNRPPVTTTLAGPIADCVTGSSDCVFHVGARADGVGRTAWEMQGVVASLHVYPTAAHATFPQATAAFATADFISSSVSDR